MMVLPLVDRYGRVATDLRVSLTDRCNLRCTYCMPVEGLAWLPSAELLTDEEINRLIRIAVTRLGVTEIRFTGGEPTLRPGLLDIVAAAAELRPRPQLSLTTNGIGLDRLAEPLRAAGLTRVNVSLDTLDPDRFFQLAHRRRLPDTLAGLAAAADAGLGPVKINTVLIRGVNDDEAVPLLRYALAHGYQQRFIEQMPLDAGHTWDRARMITADEILSQLREGFELLPDPVERGGAPAETWLVAGEWADPTNARSAQWPDGQPEDQPAGNTAASAGAELASLPRVGVIASVTRPFCAACDRTRLTADGQLRNCLFARNESDLRTPLRAGAPDDEIAERWQIAMAGKLAGHGIDDPGFLQPARPMSAIGG
jgi:cyclic pyranopterin phosphate synthase